ncbi:hypothetical protein ES703_121172 [subsurface metagenome]
MRPQYTVQIEQTDPKCIKVCVGPRDIDHNFPVFGIESEKTTRIEVVYPYPAVVGVPSQTGNPVIRHFVLSQDFSRLGVGISEDYDQQDDRQ